jgi:hypothetical protein
MIQHTICTPVDVIQRREKRLKIYLTQPSMLLCQKFEPFLSIIGSLIFDLLLLLQFPLACFKGT